LDLDTWISIDGFDTLVKPVGFEAGRKPIRNEFGQVIRLYQVGGDNW
jgi:hypothetical protein